jgi:hypothetical protein
MNDFTQRTIEALRRAHAMKAGTIEFVRGGPFADAVLAHAALVIEGRSLNEGDYGGPLNAALSFASRSADFVRRLEHEIGTEEIRSLFVANSSLDA